MTRFFTHFALQLVAVEAEKLEYVKKLFPGARNLFLKSRKYVQLLVYNFANLAQITSFVSIYIDFSNGDSLGSTDASATHIIGQRIAARAIYQCSGTELTSTLYRHQDVLQLFDFNTVMEAIRSGQPDGVCAILLILDEFNYVVKRDQAIADSIIQYIGSFMTESCNTKDTILFPVIAGTVEGQVNQSFVNCGYHKQSLTLPPLSFESIETVFKACLPVAHHKWLDFMPFRRTLLLLCSTPRALYLVLTSLAATRDEPSLQNVQAVALALQQALTKKVSQVCISTLVPL